MVVAALGPTVVVASCYKNQMAKALTRNRKLCIYNKEIQKSLVVHYKCYHKERDHLLTHFYTFLYFEDWKQDLTKISC